PMRSKPPCIRISRSIWDQFSSIRKNECSFSGDIVVVRNFERTELQRPNDDKQESEQRNWFFKKTLFPIGPWRCRIAGIALVSAAFGLFFGGSVLGHCLTLKCHWFLPAIGAISAVFVGGQGLYDLSAPRYCRSENIGIAAIVIPELKLRDVQRQIFAADLVVAAHNAAFEDRPEALNRIGVDSTDDVLPGTVVDNAMRVRLPDLLVSRVVVSAEQTDLFGNRLIDEIFQGDLADSADHFGDDVALALYRADNGRLASVIAAPAQMAALVPVAVFVASTNVGFVNLDNAAEFFFGFTKRSAYFVAHQPSGFVGPKTHEAHDLQWAHSFFAGHHQVDDAKPVAERLIRVFEDGPGDMGEAVGGLRSAVVALPVPRIALQLGHVRATAGAFDALGPTPPDKVGATGVLIGEHGLELLGRKLLDRFGATGHRNVLPEGRRILPWAA